MTEGHTMHIFSQIIFPLINFFIFIGILFYVLRRPFKNFLKERSLHVEKTIQDAQTSLAGAEAQHEKIKQKLDHFEEEKKHLLQNTEKDTAHLKKKTETALEQLVEMMKQEHEQRLKEEVRKATNTLRKVAAQKIIETSQKIIQKNLKSKEQEKVVEEYLDTISKGASWQSGSQSAMPEHS